MVSSSGSLNPKVDLRSPVFTRLRKGLGVGWLRVVTLVLVDSIALSLAWQLSQIYGNDLNSPWSIENNPLSLLPILSAGIGLIAAKGLYQSGEKRCDYLGLIKALTFSHVLLLVLAFFYQPGISISRSTFVISWLLSIVLTYTGRSCVDSTVKHLRKNGVICYPTILIGLPEHTEKAIKLLKQGERYNILRCIDISSLDRGSWKAHIENIQRLGVAEVFVCSWASIKERMFLYWSLRNAGITIHILPAELEPFARRSETLMIGGIPSTSFSPPIITGSDFWVKRCFDFCCSALFIILASPLYLSIAILIKLDSPGPVFYKQARIGLHGREFKVWKFRTMVNDADKLQKELEASNEMKDGVLFKMKNDPRITRVGKFLRLYSLDELPQLFNTLLGEMSLVGPRPLPIRDIQKFSEHHFIRHEVLPGITGLWQVSGRSDITNFEEVVSLDTFYMENWSLWLDLQILMQTVFVILKKKGAY